MSIRFLIYLGLFANTVTTIWYYRLNSMDSVMAYFFICMPILWGCLLVFMIMVMIRNYSTAFNSENLTQSLLAIILSTPLPSLIVYYWILSMTPPNVK